MPGMGVLGRVADRLFGSNMPMVLIIVEIALVVVLIRNIECFLFITFYIPSEPIDMFKGVSAVVITLVMSIFTVETMIGLPSSKRSSWRTAVRTMILLVPTTLFYELTDYGYVALSTNTILVVMAVTLLIMFLPHVRRYYVPFMTEAHPLKDWLKLIVLRPSQVPEYEFVYE